jgi:restriction endonuclease S subunit
MAVTHIITTSCFEFGNRIDAELYQPSLKSSYLKICASGFEIKLLRRLCTIRSGTTPPNRDDGLKSGPILFKTTDVRNRIIPPNGCYYRISNDIHQKMFKTKLQQHDVLLNIVGATLDVIGRTAFINNLPEEANITQAMVFLRCNTPEILPGYLFAYLNTIFAQDQVKRFARPTGQYNLNLHEVGQIRIVLLPKSNQVEINDLIISAARLQEISEESYLKAQKLLETELGLDKLTFQKPVGFTARFSELEQSRRSDAQHYQPRFAQLLGHLADFASKQIRDIRICNRRGLQPHYVEGGRIDVVNSQHLGLQHIDYDGLQKTSDKDFAVAIEGHIQNNDLLIYTTGAYIGRTNVYLSSAPALASNHVNILRLNSGIDAAYMALVFQSIVGQFQTQKHARGSAQAELYPADIDRFIVPLIDPSKQAAIGDLARNSLEKQQETKRLLYQAKTRVEQLIEEAVRS